MEEEEGLFWSWLSGFVREIFYSSYWKRKPGNMLTLSWGQAEGLRRRRAQK